MENQRLHFIEENLLEELLLCEKFVRRLFFDADVSDASGEDPFERLTYSPSKAAVRTVLCNYIYDAYIRLVISEKRRYVEQMDNAGSLLFLWSIRRAFEMHPGLLRDDQDLVSFSKLLNNLRRTSSLDILMPEALQFLERAICVGKDGTGTSFIVENSARATKSSTIAVREDSLLSLKTRYDPQFESKFFDHSTHYEEAFVPSHRFCNSRQSVLNMSRYVGYTMRENIRRLYNYVSQNLGDQVCPCVVIFNFFIRDSYRMYYSKSLRQTSFVTVFVPLSPRLPSLPPSSQSSATADATINLDQSAHFTRRNAVPLSYMIMTNLFPKVGSWFKSINNQLIKKMGKMHIQHLDSFVRMLTQLRYQENNESGAIACSTGAVVSRATIASRPNELARSGDSGDEPIVARVVDLLTTNHSRKTTKDKCRKRKFTEIEPLTHHLQDTTTCVATSNDITSTVRARGADVSLSTMMKRGHSDDVDKKNRPDCAEANIEEEKPRHGKPTRCAGAKCREGKNDRQTTRKTKVPSSAPSSSSLPDASASTTSVSSSISTLVASSSSSSSSTFPLVTRVSLSSLYRASETALFSEMFSTRFRSCRHAHIVRTYEQMRANDESATLVRICLDCGNRI